MSAERERERERAALSCTRSRHTQWEEWEEGQGGRRKEEAFLATNTVAAGHDGSTALVTTWVQVW